MSTQRFSELKQFNIRAFDRRIGMVDDILIDDLSWLVRYLVVSIEGTLPTRKVLISPAVVEGPDLDQRLIAVGLVSQQVVDSPPLDSNGPISRRYEQALVDYYGWPIYWLGRIDHGSPQKMERMETDTSSKMIRDDLPSNLRSAAELCGYWIDGSDGFAGYMKDLIIHMDKWSVEFATADPSSSLPKEKFMFSCSRIDNVDWTAQRVDVDLSKEQIAEPNNDAVWHAANITGEPWSAQPFRAG